MNPTTDQLPDPDRRLSLSRAGRFNSFIVASAVTVIKVVIDSMAGYAFAKMSFPGSDALFLRRA